MPLPTTTLTDLANHLDALGVGPQKNLVVHSRLISFGRLQGGAAAVYQAIRDKVGAASTIAVPAYTFGLGEADLYDARQTPSMEVGVFSEYVRQLPGAVRSACPIHSHAAVGPAAHLLAAVSGNASLGPGSDFEMFLKNGFWLLLLGCEFEEGATIIHHMEAEVGVPYRAWRNLPRRCMVDGREQHRSVRYYARASDRWAEDFAKVRVRLEKAGLVQAANCPIGRSYLVSLHDIAGEVRAMLQSDPFAVVRPVDPT